MDNPARTAAYHALTAERRRGVREFLTSVVAPGTAFTWEVGCGHGHFLSAYALAHPGRTCVGVDISSDRIDRAIRKRDRARVSNLHFLQAEAALFLRELPDGVSLERIFILFPDPWPKLRHHKHRVVQSVFLDEVAARATPDCRIYFRTDYLPYFHRTALLLGAHPAWQLADEPWPYEHATVFQARAVHHHSLVAVRRPPSTAAPPHSISIGSHDTPVNFGG
jgi:tRNA (guanine-N7-)-methyltransferase